MNPLPQTQAGQDPRLAQAQVAAQAQQGLGTPPQQEFDYKRNPSMDLMDAHVSKQQQVLAAKMAQEQGQQGYAGYRGEATPLVTPSQAQGQGWTPPSPEAHKMNVQLAERIKSGQLDQSTAMIAIQHPDVAPEIKQALSQMMQAQSAGQSEPQMQGAPTGLGQVVA